MQQLTRIITKAPVATILIKQRIDKLCFQMFSEPVQRQRWQTEMG